MVQELAGKTVLITGASRGIGADMARRLGSAGALVLCVARTADAASGAPQPGTLAETVARIRQDGGKAEAYAADMTDAAARADLAGRVLQAHGAIDVLINNAASGGTPLGTKFETLSDAQFDLAVEINARAPLHMAQLFVPAMRARQRGWVINISSRSAQIGHPPYHPLDLGGGVLLYAAAKAMQDRITSGMAAELFDSGVTVNALSPTSFVRTPGTAKHGIDDFVGSAPGDPPEAMAEAAVAIIAHDPPFTGRFLYSLEFLGEIGRKMRTLDGSREI